MPTPLGVGRAALAVGDWAAARNAFTEATQGDDSADALDGLAHAAWWLNDVPAALDLRIRAHNAFRQEGRRADAATSAVWISRQFRQLFRNTAAADGWLARAETLAGEGSPGDSRNDSTQGWIALARSEATPDAATAAASAHDALNWARAHSDPDLEIEALARLGLLTIATGEVDAGVHHLDEAMAAASAGAASDLTSVATAYCTLLEAAELLGDDARFAQWTAAITAFGSGPGFGPLIAPGSPTAYGPLSSFCGACCGGLYLVTGRLADAEAELLAAIAELESSGMASRCVHPVTRLAELRVLQGRLDEARTLLELYEDLPEAVRPLAVLDLAAGSPDIAVARLSRRLDEIGGLEVAALPLLTVLVDAQLAAGDRAAAQVTTQRVTDVADRTHSTRHRAEALFARGKVAAAAGEPNAEAPLRDAARLFSECELGLQACRARVALARALAAEGDIPIAITEARAALAAFDRLGARPDADAASAFLRELGVRGRTGPKNLDLLSQREREVLGLVAQGLTNAEIAERLFISVKTAGHHVGSILMKLGVRSRTEAAAFAAVHAELRMPE
ncbi:LuxR family transcriptional regulator [Salinibacterium sp. ZJ450]|uniref:helix-turn-helix transcriptional regulator n=1 Tax=Salinibacterium sp. ZJ450 TaxID=2708338 RepID=UPI00141E20FB|nr:LuxR family transcriptional regulator [Salinibacterium sp. ZJ450]